MLFAHLVARAYALLALRDRLAERPPPEVPAAAARRIAAERGAEEILE